MKTLFLAATIFSLLTGSLSWAGGKITITEEAANCLKSIQAEKQVIVCRSLNQVNDHGPTLLLALIGARRLVAQRNDVKNIAYKARVDVSEIKFIPARLTDQGAQAESLQFTGSVGKTRVSVQIPCGQNLEAFIASAQGSASNRSLEYLPAVCGTTKL